MPSPAHFHRYIYLASITHKVSWDSPVHYLHYLHPIAPKTTYALSNPNIYHLRLCFPRMPRSPKSSVPSISHYQRRPHAHYHDDSIAGLRISCTNSPFFVIGEELVPTSQHSGDVETSVALCLISLLDYFPPDVSRLDVFLKTTRELVRCLAVSSQRLDR